MLYTDADLPFEMIELVRAIRVMRTYEADIVSAYRLDRTGEGPRRAVYSWVYNWLIQLAFGTRLRDINFAFKLCRRSVLDHVTLSSEGSFIDAELVIRAQKAGFAHRADRRRLLPANPWGVDPVLAGRDQDDARRDGRLRGELKALPPAPSAVTGLLIVSADDLGLTDGV